MEELKIYQKVYDMIVYGNNCLLQFPRSERYALATDIKKSMYALLKLVIEANKKYYKKTTLQEMDVELEALKTYIRIAADPKFKYLGLKQYEIWGKMLSEIGRMLGGWMKAINK